MTTRTVRAHVAVQKSRLTMSMTVVVLLVTWVKLPLKVLLDMREVLVVVIVEAFAATKPLRLGGAARP